MTYLSMCLAVSSICVRHCKLDKMGYTLRTLSTLPSRKETRQENLVEKTKSATVLVYRDATWQKLREQKTRKITNLEKVQL